MAAQVRGGPIGAYSSGMPIRCNRALIPWSASTSATAVLYPARVPPGRQVALLDQLLRDFAKPPLHPARTLTE